MPNIPTVESEIQKVLDGETTKLSLGGFFQLEEIPEAVFDLKQLTELHVSGSRFVNVSPRVARLRNLERLELGGDFLELPDTIGSLKHIKYLKLDGDFTTIPASYQHLTSLIHLHIKGNYTTIPDILGGLSNLEQLILQGRFKSLPRSLMTLITLTSLYLDGWSFHLPDGLQNLKQLRSLRLEGLTNIPDAIGELSNLDFMVLKGGYNTIPESIAKLDNLQTLKLWGGYYKRLPQFLFDMPKLGHLEVNKDVVEPPMSQFGDESYASYYVDMNGCREYFRNKS